MAVKISALPDAATLTGAEEVPVVQGGSTVKTTTQEIANLAPAGPTLPLSIGQGGTGEATAQDALDALFASVAKGTIIIGDGSNNTPLAVGADGHVLTAASGQPNGVQWAAPAPGSIAIGQAIAGGTAGRILIQGAGPVLADTVDLTWGSGGQNLAVTSPNANPAVSIAAGGDSVNICQVGVGSRFHSGPGTDCQLATPTVALLATDGVRTVSICDGTNNVSYTPATPANWAGVAPTDVWLALDRLAAVAVIPP